MGTGLRSTHQRKAISSAGRGGARSRSALAISSFSPTPLRGQRREIALAEGVDLSEGLAELPRQAIMSRRGRLVPHEYVRPRLPLDALHDEAPRERALAGQGDRPGDRHSGCVQGAEQRVLPGPVQRIRPAGEHVGVLRRPAGEVLPQHKGMHSPVRGPRVERPRFARGPPGEPAQVLDLDRAERGRQGRYQPAGAGVEVVATHGRAFLPLRGQA